MFDGIDAGVCIAQIDRKVLAAEEMRTAAIAIHRLYAHEITEAATQEERLVLIGAYLASRAILESFGAERSICTPPDISQDEWQKANLETVFGADLDVRDLR